ncbi:MAG: response regulator [Lachnospiraceae bacterium]|nr:response regulator [Lachnospiraceae bacterium]
MYKVLLVDDEPIIKIALRSIIPWEEHNMTICATASNGAEGLKLVSELSPEIIITDLKMPEMDGLEFIRHLKSHGFNGQILVLSNYEDFDSVRSALKLGANDYLLKIKIQAETLLETLNNAIHELEESSQVENAVSDSALDDVMADLLKSFLLGEESIDAFRGTYPDIDFSFAEKPCVFFDLYFSPTELSRQSRVISAYMKNTVWEAFQGIAKPYILVPNHYSILIYLPKESITVDDFDATLLSGKLINRFELYHSLSPVVMHHTSLSSISDARDALRKCSEILTLQFYRDLSVVDVSKLSLTHFIEGIYYKDLAKQILKNGASSISDTMDSLSAIITICDKSNVYPEILKSLFVKTLGHLEFLRSNLDSDTHDYFIEVCELLMTSSSAKSLFDDMSAAIQTLVSGISAENADPNRYKAEVRKALDYINENYSEQISLSTISEHVNLSSSYLCKIFKMATGVSITSYLSDLRMKKAKELLSSSDNSIKEISHAVGIDDQLYFSRMFKKFYGVSPSEFRGMS